MVTSICCYSLSSLLLTVKSLTCVILCSRIVFIDRQFPACEKEFVKLFCEIILVKLALDIFSLGFFLL